MKSGLEGRNNARVGRGQIRDSGLNEVRPGRPEQCMVLDTSFYDGIVSMKSGLEGRNNQLSGFGSEASGVGLNEVRPGRPEQSGIALARGDVMWLSQ
mgnify:CR=1 FL=1